MKNPGAVLAALATAAALDAAAMPRQGREEAAFTTATLPNVMEVGRTNSNVPSGMYQASKQRSDVVSLLKNPELISSPLAVSQMRETDQRVSELASTNTSIAIEAARRLGELSPNSARAIPALSNLILDGASSSAIHGAVVAEAARALGALAPHIKEHVHDRIEPFRRPVPNAVVQAVQRPYLNTHIEVGTAYSLILGALESATTHPDPGARVEAFGALAAIYARPHAECVAGIINGALQAGAESGVEKRAIVLLKGLFSPAATYRAYTDLLEDVATPASLRSGVISILRTQPEPVVTPDCRESVIGAASRIHKTLIITNPEMAEQVASLKKHWEGYPAPKPGPTTFRRDNAGFSAMRQTRGSNADRVDEKLKSKGE